MSWESGQTLVQFWLRKRERLFQRFYKLLNWKKVFSHYNIQIWTSGKGTLQDPHGRHWEDRIKCVISRCSHSSPAISFPAFKWQFRFRERDSIDACRHHLLRGFMSHMYCICPMRVSSNNLQEEVHPLQEQTLREVSTPWPMVSLEIFMIHSGSHKHSLSSKNRTAKLSHNVTIGFAMASQSVDPIFSNWNIMKQKEIWDVSKDTLK